ncbi:hypothetical protein [Micromonospora sp. NPDC005324]|uniref:hypothetical protein n=1 Tax=Micromonospora sp. NPDC005324 TaxID=3157033 RepID=UPI0033BED4AE
MAVAILAQRMSINGFDDMASRVCGWGTGTGVSQARTLIGAWCGHGAKRVIVAVGRSVLTIWHLLSDPEARFRDLGNDLYLTRTDTERRKRSHIHQLEALGYRVTLDLAA